MFSTVSQKNPNKQKQKQNNKKDKIASQSKPRFCSLNFQKNKNNHHKSHSLNTEL